jgi:MFS family permease
MFDDVLDGAALGDRFGRRRMFAAGIALFAAASIACALASRVDVLIAARAVQGGGAALVMPLAMALLSTAYDRRRVARHDVLGCDRSHDGALRR